jgi:hypothetical protein
MNSFNLPSVKTDYANQREPLLDDEERASARSPFSSEQGRLLRQQTLGFSNALRSMSTNHRTSRDNQDGNLALDFHASLDSICCHCLLLSPSFEVSRRAVKACALEDFLASVDSSRENAIVQWIDVDLDCLTDERLEMIGERFCLDCLVLSTLRESIRGVNHIGGHANIIPCDEEGEAMQLTVSFSSLDCYDEAERSPGLRFTYLVVVEEGVLLSFSKKAAKSISVNRGTGPSARSPGGHHLHHEIAQTLLKMRKVHYIHYAYYDAHTMHILCATYYTLYINTLRTTHHTARTEAPGVGGGVRDYPAGNSRLLVSVGCTWAARGGFRGRTTEEGIPTDAGMSTVHHAPYTIHHTLCTIHPAPYTIHCTHHALYTMHHAPCTMHHAPCTVHHTLCICTVHRISCTVHHAPYTMYHTSCTVHHAPYTMYHTPHTVHRAPCTMHHAPCTMHHTPCIMHHTQY